MGPVQLQFIIWAVSLCFSGMILRDKLELMHDNRVKWHGHVAVQRAHHVSNHNHNFSRLRLLRTVKLKVSGVSRSNAPIWFYLSISHPFFFGCFGAVVRAGASFRLRQVLPMCQR